MKSFVNKKSELTLIKDEYEAKGYGVYRTRMHCNCEPTKNRRNGIIVVNDSGKVEAMVIRCKACVNKYGRAIS